MDSSSESDYEPALRNDIEQLDRAIENDSDPDTGDQAAANIDAALALNENVNCHFQELEARLMERLAQCRNRLEGVHKNITLSLRQRSREKPQQYFKYSHCGLPYFRDKNNRIPSDNADTLQMRRTGIINYALMRNGNGWSSKDKKNLQRILLSMSRQLARRKLEERLRAAERVGGPELEEERKIISERIVDLQHASLEDVALPIEKDYDWELVEMEMQNRHSMGELRSMWRLYLHPQLAQSNFTRREYRAMEALVGRRRPGGWDAVARELGERRSGYQCFVFYRSVMAVKNSGVRWTEEEDEFLRQVVDCYRLGSYIPWSTIASCIEGKSKIQIYNRYMNSVRPQLKKGKFLPEEDAVILAAVEKYGPDFNKVAQFLPGRTVVQLRLRYTLSLAVNISAHWTLEEDQLLLRLINANSCPESNGTNYAAAAEHFPNKNRNNLRMRHITLMKFLRSNPNADLRLAPRRRPRLIHRARKVDLATAVVKLAQRIERGEETPPPSKSGTLDRKLVSYFINELTEKDEDPLQLIKSETMEDTDNLRRVLLLLKANIDKARFTRDDLGARYVKLFAPDADETFKPVRTYSRQGSVYRGPMGANVVTVWSDTRAFATEYILPPNYDTVTACRSAMLEAHADLNRRQLSLLRNPLLKTHYVKFLERCEILLTWPLVMSCVEPNEQVLKVKSVFNDNYDTSKDVGDRKKLPMSAPERPLFVGRLKGHHAGRKKRTLSDTHGDLDLPAPDPAETRLVVLEDQQGQIVAIGEPDPTLDLQDEEQVINNGPALNIAKRRRRKVKVVELDEAPTPPKVKRRSPRLKVIR